MGGLCCFVVVGDRRNDNEFKIIKKIYVIEVFTRYYYGREKLRVFLYRRVYVIVV